MEGGGRRAARRQREVWRRLADEHRDGVLELRALHADVDRLRLGGLELGLRLHHVGLGRHPARDTGSCVRLEDLSKAATVSSSSCFWASSVRSWK